jgi:hypothetical protein
MRPGLKAELKEKAAPNGESTQLSDRSNDRLMQQFSLMDPVPLSMWTFTDRKMSKRVKS